MRETEERTETGASGAERKERYLGSVLFFKS